MNEILETLTPRERDIVVLVAGGHTNSEIARALDISTHTVRNYLSRILRRTGLQSRLALTVVAIRYGLVDVKAACDQVEERSRYLRDVDGYEW